MCMHRRLAQQCGRAHLGDSLSRNATLRQSTRPTVIVKAAKRQNPGDATAAPQTHDDQAAEPSSNDVGSLVSDLLRSMPASTSAAEKNQAQVDLLLDSLRDIRLRHGDEGEDEELEGEEGQDWVWWRAEDVQQNTPAAALSTSRTASGAQASTTAPAFSAQPNVEAVRNLDQLLATADTSSPTVPAAASSPIPYESDPLGLPADGGHQLGLRPRKSRVADAAPAPQPAAAAATSPAGFAAPSGLRAAAAAGAASIDHAAPLPRAQPPSATGAPSVQPLQAPATRLPPNAAAGSEAQAHGAASALVVWPQRYPNVVSFLPADWQEPTSATPAVPSQSSAPVAAPHKPGDGGGQAANNMAQAGAGSAGAAAARGHAGGQGLAAASAGGGGGSKEQEGLSKRQPKKAGGHST